MKAECLSELLEFSEAVADIIHTIMAHPVIKNSVVRMSEEEFDRSIIRGMFGGKFWTRKIQDFH